MIKSAHIRAVLLLVLASTLFSLGGVFIKLSSWEALPLNAARSGISAVVIAVALRRIGGVDYQAQI